MLDGVRLCLRNIMHSCIAELGTQFPQTQVRILLIANGSTVSRNVLMVQFIDTKLVLLLKVSNNVMVLIMRIPSALLSRQLLLDLFWQLMSPEAGV
jgi:hypothetical protein